MTTQIKNRESDIGEFEFLYLLYFCVKVIFYCIEALDLIISLNSWYIRHTRYWVKTLILKNSY